MICKCGRIAAMNCINKLCKICCTKKKCKRHKKKFFPNKLNIKNIINDIYQTTDISLDVVTNVIMNYYNNNAWICCKCGLYEECPDYCYQCDTCQKIFCDDCDPYQCNFVVCKDMYCISGHCPNNNYKGCYCSNCFVLGKDDMLKI